MALVNLSVSQNKTKKHEHERQTDRQTGTDIHRESCGEEEMYTKVVESWGHGSSQYTWNTHDLKVN